MPSKGMVYMMAAAILSDTVMFKSPTCTDRDRRMAERLARMADVSLDELGKAIFSGSLGNKTAQELLFTDYKEFHIAGHDFAVSQITCVDSPSMLQRKAEFLEHMRKQAEKESLMMMILMLTDVLLEGTQLLYVGDDDTIQQAFGVTPKDNSVFLPRVMSRKKQIIPMLSALWGLKMGFDGLLGNEQIKRNLAASLKRAIFPILPDLRPGGLRQAHPGKASGCGHPLPGGRQALREVYPLPEGGGGRSPGLHHRGRSGKEDRPRGPDSAGSGGYLHPAQ